MANQLDRQYQYQEYQKWEEDLRQLGISYDLIQANIDMNRVILRNLREDTDALSAIYRQGCTRWGLGNGERLAALWGRFPDPAWHPPC